MWQLLATFLAATAASLTLTGAIRWLARRWGVLDYPDGWRKLHRRPTPLWGGVAVYVAILIGLALARYGQYGVGEPLDKLSAAIAAAGGFVCFFGCLDDVYRLSARSKLLLQVVAVFPVVLAGNYVDRIAAFGIELQLGWLGVPLTALWLLGCINALNLMDGMDGLASLVGLATVTMLGVVAAYLGNAHVAAIAVVLAGAIAGFLFHNLPPARVFLGDSGSMTIGLIVGLLGIQSTLKMSTTLAITAPLVIMTFPMFDTLLAVVRRGMTGNGLAAADRKHIHHRLLDRGWHPWLVLALIAALCLVSGAAAAFTTILHTDWPAWMTVAVLLVLVVRLRLFGHHEWRLVAEALRDSARRALRLIGGREESPDAPLAGQAVGQPAGHTAGALWAELHMQLASWNVRQIELRLCGDDASWSHFHCESMRGQIGRRQWTLGVRSEESDGRTCELRVVSDERSARSLAALSTLLEQFAERFGRFSDLELGVAPAGAPLAPVASASPHDPAVPHGEQHEHKKAA